MQMSWKLDLQAEFSIWTSASSGGSYRIPEQPKLIANFMSHFSRGKATLLCAVTEYNGAKNAITGKIAQRSSRGLLPICSQKGKKKSSSSFSSLLSHTWLQESSSTNRNTCLIINQFKNRTEQNSRNTGEQEVESDRRGCNRPDTKTITRFWHCSMAALVSGMFYLHCAVEAETRRPSLYSWWTWTESSSSRWSGFFTNTSRCHLHIQITNFF